MKLISLGAVAIALLSAVAARAADMPNRKYSPQPAEPAYIAPVPVFTWTGFYAGVNAGGNWGSATGGASQFWGSPSGAVFGLIGGYNYQIGQVVLGVEGDWDIDGARGTKSLPGPIVGVGKLTNELTVRGRLGYAADRALVYVTGGYAGGWISGSIADATTVPPYFSNAGWHNGFAVGAGIEYAFTNNISGKAEYLFTGLNQTNVFSPPHAITAGINESAVRAGVNYHF